MQRRRLILASGNPGKALEVEEILSDVGVEVSTITDMVSDFTVVEDGDSFQANALKKAMAAWDLLSAPVIADDSGLCVQALDGAPGIHSARYGGPGGTDRDRYLRLLDTLKDTPADKRTAWFECCMIAIVPEDWVSLEDRAQVMDGPAQGFLTLVAQGRVMGVIGQEPAGQGGFGYDPVFLPNGFQGKTMAQLGSAQKHQISHRGNALGALLKQLKS
jgi:XTP/dITP diphosphohydrolase